MPISFDPCVMTATDNGPTDPLNVMKGVPYYVCTRPGQRAHGGYQLGTRYIVQIVVHLYKHTHPLN